MRGVCSPGPVSTGLLIVLFPLAVCAQQPVASTPNPDAIGTLKSLAAALVGTDTNFLGRTRFAIENEKHTFFYDLTPVPPSLVLSAGDPSATPLEALIRVEALRRDFTSTIPGETFWAPPLDSVADAIRRCIPETADCSKEIESRFESLKEQTVAYAAGRGLSFYRPLETRDPVAGYRVHISVDPPKARVRIMTLLQFRVYQRRQTPKEQYRWRDLLEAEVDLIGWYHYRAEWSPELNGPEEGDFEIRKPGKLTFTPANK